MSARAALRVAAAAAVLALLAFRFDPREFARRHGAQLRLSVATGGTGGVYYPYGGGIAQVISAHVPNAQATAEVTAGSVDNLKLIRDGKADLGFTLADTLDDAARGRGAFARSGRVPVRALARLYTNATHVVARTGGPATVAEMRGRPVSTGSPGSGTETIAFRLLQAAGLDPDRDVSRQGLGAGPSAEALRDGKIDAFFWSGGVPTAAIVDLFAGPGARARLLPTDAILPELRRRFGDELYGIEEIPAGAYPGLNEPVRVVSVANLLVVDAGMGEALAYEITRALFVHRDALVAIHPEARRLRPESAVRGSPVEFHPGAVRFYREAGVWSR